MHRMSRDEYKKSVLYLGYPSQMTRQKWKISRKLHVVPNLRLWTWQPKPGQLGEGQPTGYSVFRTMLYVRTYVPCIMAPLAPYRVAENFSWCKLGWSRLIWTYSIQNTALCGVLHIFFGFWLNVTRLLGGQSIPTGAFDHSRRGAFLALVARRCGEIARN